MRNAGAVRHISFSVHHKGEVRGTFVYMYLIQEDGEDRRRTLSLLYPCRRLVRLSGALRRLRDVGMTYQKVQPKGVYISYVLVATRGSLERSIKKG